MRCGKFSRRGQEALAQACFEALEPRRMLSASVTPVTWSAPAPQGVESPWMLTNGSGNGQPIQREPTAPEGRPADGGFSAGNHRRALCCSELLAFFFGGQLDDARAALPQHGWRAHLAQS